MKALFILILIFNVCVCANAQREDTYLANSPWVRINTKVFSKPEPPKETKNYNSRTPSANSGQANKSAKSFALIEDNFKTQTNPYGWRTSELNGTNYQRGNGAYKISRVSGLTDATVIIESGCVLDSVDFLLETVIASKGEIPPRAGLVWGYKDKDNYMALKLNSKGEYAFIFMNSGENVEDSGFIRNRYILKTLDNKLTVRKQGIKLIFYINDVQIGEGNYGYMSSSRIGFIMSDSEAVFKWFKFQQISN